MAAWAGLLNRPTAAQTPLVSGGNSIAALPQASGNSAASTSASISSNDFLTLLVTEMKNQDPTANTDPNQYVNQLVQVNSLEQLISINQTLGTALGSTGGTTGSGKTQPPVAGSDLAVSGAPAAAVASPPTSALAGAMSHEAAGAAPLSMASAIGKFVDSTGAGRAPGNLSIPAASASAHRVAQALGGQRRTHVGSGQLSGLK